MKMSANLGPNGGGGREFQAASVARFSWPCIKSERNFRPREWASASLGYRETPSGSVINHSRARTTPEIGTKFAERIVLELKEKITKLSFRHVPETPISLNSTMEADLVSSVVNLGYKVQQAKALAGRIITRSGSDLSLNEAVGLALNELAV